MTAPNNPQPDDLPDVGTFASFQSLTADGITVRDLANGACVVPEFVFSQMRWANSLDRSTRQVVTLPSPEGTVTHRQPPAWTLEGILAQSIQDWSCVHCGNRGNDCLGAQCVQDFRQNSQNVLDCLEIRDTGEMQYGVYCKGDTIIPAGTILGEYIGELLPPDTDVNDVLKNDAYGFGIPGIGYVTAKTYGNWTRFVNHTCVQNNVMTRRVMYGKRLVMAFIAKTDIQPGDQLYSSYGRQYFVNMRSRCVCTDWDRNGAPHLPPTLGDLEVAGRVPARVPKVIDTLANLRQLRDVRPANSARPTAYTDSRTFEIDVSAGGSFVTTREFTIPRSALVGGNKTIDIDLILRRRGGRGGRVTRPIAVTPATVVTPARTPTQRPSEGGDTTARAAT